MKRAHARVVRMHETIAQFPSKALYSSALISHESVASRRLIDLPSIVDKESEDAQDILEPTLVFFDTAGTEMYERLEGDEVDSSLNKTSVGEGSRYNENEAEIVSKWVRQLVCAVLPKWYAYSRPRIVDSTWRHRSGNRDHHAVSSASGPSFFPIARRIPGTRLWLGGWYAGTGEGG